MKYLSLIIALLWATVVHGQIGALFIDKTAAHTISDLGLEPSSKGFLMVAPVRFSSGAIVYDTPAGMTNGQYVIGSYANDASSAPGSYPAGGVMGYGRASVLRATSDIMSVAAATRGVVVSQNFNGDIGGWQRTTGATQAANLRQFIRDCTIVGYDFTADDYFTEGVVDSQPNVKTPSTAGITGATNASPIVITTNTAAVDIWAPNTGMSVTISGVNGNTAANGTWTVTRISQSQFSLNGSDGTLSGTYTSGGTWTRNDLYHGAMIRGSGSRIENVGFYYIPGTCIQLRAGGGSRNGQFGPWDSEKSVVRNVSFKRAYRGLDIFISDAVCGEIEAEGLDEYAIKVQDNCGGLQIDGWVHAYGIGNVCLWVDNDAGKVFGAGPFYLENANYGAYLESNGGLLSNFHSHTCTTANVALTWEAERWTLENVDIVVNNNTASVPVGIRWDGWHNSVIGGVIECGEADAIGVVFGEVQVGSQMRGAILKGVQLYGPSDTTGTGIVVEHTLRGCYIQVHADRIGTVADFLDGATDRIGTGNTIVITYDDETVNGATPVELHADWTTTPDASEDNFVMINGVRYYRD